MPESKRNRTAAHLAGRLSVLAVALLTWTIFARGPGQPADLPTPWQALLALSAEMATSDFWLAVGQTLLTTTVGIVASAAIGIPLGVLIGFSRRLDLSTRVLVDFGRFIPAVALLPLVLLLFGASRSMQVTLILLSAVWPLLIQSTYAVRELSPQLRNVARVFHLTFADRLRFVYLPSAMPFLATGIRIAATVCLLMAVSSEFLGGAPGVGRNLYLALQVNDGSKIVVYALTAAGIGIAVTYFFLFLQRRVLFWHPSVREESLR